MNCYFVMWFQIVDHPADKKTKVEEPTDRLMNGACRFQQMGMQTLLKTLVPSSGWPDREHEQRRVGTHCCFLV